MKHKNLPLAFTTFIIALIAFVNIPANAGTANGPNKQFFIENKGQWPDEVLYLACIAGMNAWITNNGVVYDHFIIERNYEPSGLLSLPVHERRMAEMENTTIRGHVVKMSLEGTGRNAASAGIDKKPGYYNYFKGNDPEKWASYVPLYGKIEIHEVYEGINVKYYFDGGLLRYDFHVKAGSDINQIRFSLEGQEAWDINKNGELVYETRLGEVTHGQLYAYQFINGAEKEVACSFLQNPDGTLGIVAENYDPDKELVIDPLVFSTYLGGNSHESAETVKLAQDGNIIIAGGTGGMNFPVTPGAYQTTPQSTYDMFVTKLTSDLEELVFSTFISGNNTDYLRDMALGNDGSVFITGWTSSVNYPVTPNAFQSSHGGGWDDAFVTRLHPSGSSLIYSTFLGGSDLDYGVSISMNNNDEAIVMGDTGSRHDFPVTPGSLHSEWGGVFISKFNSNGTALIFSATIDNIRSDAMTIDDNGKIYLAGNGNDYNFPITPGAFQENCPGWGGCASIVVINSNATAILYSTFLGGTDSEYATVITLANNGDVVIGGYTRSTDFPVSPNAFQTAHSGFLDIFVSRLNPTLTTLLWSTYVGGFSAEMCNDIVLDANENVYFTGHTQSYNYPLTPGAFQTTRYQTAAIISKLSSDGSELLYSTYLGGINTDRGNSICLVQNDHTIIAGFTESPDFPVTAGAFQYAHQGGADAFISKLITSNCLITLATQVNSNVSCYGGNDGSATIEPAAGHPPYAYLWNDGQTGATAFNLEAGVYTVIVTDSIGCTATESILIEEPPLLVVEQSDITPASCFDSSDGSATIIISGGTAPYLFSWSNGETGDTAIALAVGNHFVIVTDANGCEETINFSIGHIPAPVPEIVGTQAASCVYRLDGVAIAEGSEGTPPYTFAWSNGETGDTATTLPVGENTVTIIDSNGCEETISFSIDYIRPYDGELICAVTVNPETGKNTILWEKTENVRTIAYNIYREGSASGVYEMIGSRLFSEPSVFTDTLANPAQQSYRYKLALIDSCQEESALSILHKSVHLSMNVGVNNEINLLWTAYEGFDYPTHYIMRSIDNEPFQQIGLVPSTNLSFTDVAPPTGYKKYMVEIDMPEGCSFLKDGLRIQSNTVIHEPSGIGNLAGKVGFIIYPNPGDGFFTLIFQTPVYEADLTITVFDLLGSILHTQEITSGSLEVKLNLQQLPGGIYYLRVAGSNISGSVKVVKL